MCFKEPVVTATSRPDASHISPLLDSDWLEEAVNVFPGLIRPRPGEEQKTGQLILLLLNKLKRLEETSLSADHFQLPLENFQTFHFNLYF